LNSHFYIDTLFQFQSLFVKIYKKFGEFGNLYRFGAGTIPPNNGSFYLEYWYTDWKFEMGDLRLAIAVTALMTGAV